MKIYLVGGAVRDQLLGLPYQEKDWVVIGSTPEEMLHLGFRSVGKDFPVFLHPETYEEYALARTERKTGRGYTQFDFYASPSVSLEEDLSRRDLTVNAMAMSDDNEIIDPYHGQEDLKSRVLRHVSKAFIEDPVRILRVARLLARLAPLGFKIAEETYDLMREMVSNGEVDALVPNRVWAEWNRALGEAEPERFFEVLEQCGALIKLFPEIKKIPPNPPRNKCGGVLSSRMVRFALTLLDVKPDQIKSLCQRYPVPINYRELALLANKTKNDFYQKNYSAKLLLNLLEKVDAFRRTERFYLVLEIFKDSPIIANIKKAFECTKNISAESFIQQGYSGKIVAEKIREKRVEVIEKNV